MTEKKKIRVLIIDDHELLRKGISSILSATPDMLVVGEAVHENAAIALARTTKPEVALFDLRLSASTDGLKVTRELTDKYKCKVIIFASSEREPYPGRALQAGAVGYLSKGCDALEMLNAIRSVMVGDHYMTTGLAQQLALRQLSSEKIGNAPFDLLSERELQVLVMLSNGLDSPEIAEKMGLSPKTVNTYRYRLFEKLGVASDVGLIRMAVRHRLLEEE